MVKYIDPKNVFDSETKCFHKSISGGSIKHIKEALEYHEANLKNVKLFIVTCGSNDCDSTYKDAQAVISLYLNLARTMKKLFPDAKLIFNKLVPRMDTKFSELAVSINIKMMLWFGEKQDLKEYQLKFQRFLNRKDASSIDSWNPVCQIWSRIVPL